MGEATQRRKHKYHVAAGHLQRRGANVDPLEKTVTVQEGAGNDTFGLCDYLRKAHGFQIGRRNKNGEFDTI